MEEEDGAQGDAKQEDKEGEGNIWKSECHSFLFIITRRMTRLILHQNSLKSPVLQHLLHPSVEELCVLRVLLQCEGKDHGIHIEP